MVQYLYFRIFLDPEILIDHPSGWEVLRKYWSDTAPLRNGLLANGTNRVDRFLWVPDICIIHIIHTHI